MSVNTIRHIRTSLIALLLMTGLAALTVCALGIFAFWPQWMGTTLGAMTLGTFLIVAAARISTGAVRGRVLTSLMIAAGPAGLIAVNAVMISAIFSGFAHTFMFSIVGILLVVSFPLTLLSCGAIRLAVRTTRPFSSIWHDLLVGRAVREKSGWRLGNFIAILGMAISIPALLIISTTFEHGSVALLLIVNAITVGAFGSAVGPRDQTVITNIALCLTSIMSTATLVSAFTMVNYYADLPEMSRAMDVPLRFLVGIPISIFSLLLCLKKLTLRLDQ